MCECTDLHFVKANVSLAYLALHLASGTGETVRAPVLTHDLFAASALFAFIQVLIHVLEITIAADMSS